MSCTPERDFTVPKGETWHPTIRWATGVMTTKAITGVTKAAPAVVSCAGHALPSGWPAAVIGVQGMTQINAPRFPPTASDWHDTSNPDANSVALLDVSAADYSAYSAGGFLVYDTPQTLVGASFTLGIYDNPEHTGTALATLTSAGGTITVDTTAKTITPLLQTAALSWTTGYYKLLATDASAVVTELLQGVITID